MRVGYSLKRLVDVARAMPLCLMALARDRWTRRQLETYQQQRLQRLVRYALSHSPFYKELYGSIRTERPVKLEELPIIDKKTMMQKFDRFVTDRRLRLTDLEAHIGQLSRDEYFRDEYRVLTTAGSSGFKGVFVYNREAWSTAIASIFRWGMFMGVRSSFPKRMKCAMIAAGSAAHGSYRGATGADIGLSKWLLLRATDSLDFLVDSLNTFQPELIIGYPSMLALLAAERLEGRLNIHPRLVSTAGEVRTDDMELQIRKAWGIVPFQGYGMTEAFYVACDDTFHRGMHVFEDLVILEVVDDQNRPVPDGQTGAKVLLTNLYNFAQPLIRYEVPDLITMATKPCPCGRPYKLVAKVEGRRDDILYLRNDHGQDLPVHPLHFRSTMVGFEEVKEYQAIHEAAGIRLRVVLREGASAEKVALQLKAKLKGTLESVRVRCPEVRIEFLDKIERDPRQMGKLKLVISTLPRPGV